MRQNSGRVKHRKGKQQTEVKVPIQVIWESRNKSKDLSKNLCPYPKLLMNLPPFFQANSFLHLQKRKKTPPSGSSELFSCLFPLLKRMHSSNSALFLAALFASLEKCMSRRNSNSSEKKNKSHIYHPLKVQSSQSTSRVMRSWYLTPLKVLQQNEGGESQWLPMPVKSMLLLS